MARMKKTFPSRYLLELPEFDNRQGHQRPEPEYSRSGAAAQRRKEEICLSELRAQIFRLFAAPPRRCERIIF
jgi:hypothetical protein